MKSQPVGKQGVGVGGGVAWGGGGGCFAVWMTKLQTVGGGVAWGGGGGGGCFAVWMTKLQIVSTGRTRCIFIPAFTVAFP